MFMPAQVHQRVVAESVTRAYDDRPNFAGLMHDREDRKILELGPRNRVNIVTLRSGVNEQVHVLKQNGEPAS